MTRVDNQKHLHAMGETASWRLLPDAAEEEKTKLDQAEREVKNKRVAKEAAQRQEEEVGCHSCLSFYPISIPTSPPSTLLLPSSPTPTLYHQLHPCIYPLSRRCGWRLGYQSLVAPYAHYLPRAPTSSTKLCWIGFSAKSTPKQRRRTTKRSKRP